MISFFFSRDHQSSFTFGDYNQSMVKNGSAEDGYGVHWFDLTSKNYWQVKIQDIIVESKSVYGKNIDKVILDSGTSLITVPNSDFESIMKIYSKNYPSTFQCQKTPAICYFIGSCDGIGSKIEHIKI